MTIESRRYRQLQRVLLLIDLLAPLRYGVELQHIVSDIRDIGQFTVGTRTVYRDLQAIESIGIAERRTRDDGVVVWRLSRVSSIARTLRHVAESYAELSAA